MLRIPQSTYRVQFQPRVGFKETANLIDYLHTLGITDLYASPLLKANPGSTHGYDVVDYTILNPDLGNEEQLKSLSEHLKSHQMGLLMDLVSDHMWVETQDNVWWNDLLQNGLHSPYKDFFNINWQTGQKTLDNKVLLPLLSQHYGEALIHQEIVLHCEDGIFCIGVGHRRLPTNPSSWQILLNQAIKKESTVEVEQLLQLIKSVERKDLKGQEKIKERAQELFRSSESFRRAIESLLKDIQAEKGIKKDLHVFDQFLEDQVYRLSFWRATNHELNYRRFFDVNEFIGMRMEEQPVFDAVHQYLFELIKKGWITGLRIDHVDGITDPESYLKQLEEGCSSSSGSKERFYIIVEKILALKESLRKSWQVFGTSGYEFLNVLNGLFVDPASEKSLKNLFEELTDYHVDIAEEIFKCKKWILNHHMYSELTALTAALQEITIQRAYSRDFTFEQLRFALREFIACFPVYRSYIRSGAKQVDPEDQKVICFAIERAKKQAEVRDDTLFDFLQSLLLEEGTLPLLHQFVRRFQLLTSPVMAKGYEDTFIYRYLPLVSLNEVGSALEQFSISVDDFHAHNLRMLQSFPHTMLTTTTHDTKRSEDVRARINVISELPRLWKGTVKRWIDLNQTLIPNLPKEGIHEQYLLYQTVVGTWKEMSPEEHARYIERIVLYMFKAIKEAKLHTNWTAPQLEYEKNVEDMIREVLSLSNAAFWEDFKHFIKPVIQAGFFNSLSQIFLKMMSPGVPDLYQGCESWSFTLVDPDNRLPVNYAPLQEMQKQLIEKERADLKSLLFELVEKIETGAIKMYLIYKCLNFRRAYPQLFNRGSYEPLKIIGSHQNAALGFIRNEGEKTIICLTGRYFYPWVSQQKGVVKDVWKETKVELPLQFRRGQYRDVLTGEIYQIQGNELFIRDVFQFFPFALLESQE